jgi:PmbA protein
MTVCVAPSILTMTTGDDSPEPIIAGVDQGLYLTELLGFGENLTSGDFSRGAAGIWIDNGQLAYPDLEIDIAGLLHHKLKDIDAVGDDVEILGRAAAPTFGSPA